MIKTKGKILFDPVNVTKKHNKQGSWKRMAMVMLDGDLSKYYAWFLKKRYNEVLYPSIKNTFSINDKMIVTENTIIDEFILNKPLRGSHISFINDSLNDMKKGLNINSDKEVNDIWNKVRNKWNNVKIDITLSLDVRSDKNHWWLNIPEEERILLHNIRKELGLGRPFWGLHMSLGYVNEKNMDKSDFLLNYEKNL